MSDHEHLRTLVLNNNYQPINLFPLSLIPVESSVVRVFNGTCTAVYDYDISIKTNARNLNVKKWFWPSVIARNSGNYLHRDGVHVTSETLYYRDMGTCAYCGTFLEKGQMTVDHVMPSSRGGSGEWENIVCACERCNSEKGEKLPQGGWRPKHRLFKPTYWDIVENRKRFPLIIYDQRWLEFIPQWKAEVIIRSPMEFKKDAGALNVLEH